MRYIDKKTLNSKKNEHEKLSDLFLKLKATYLFLNNLIKYKLNIFFHIIIVITTSMTQIILIFKQES